MPQGHSSQEIYEILHREIMSLAIKPGDPLPENALCARFNVSRTPIRSVLQELRINGLVEVTPYKCTRVTRLDLDLITQQIYLRCAVESAVLADYGAVCTPEELARLRARNAAMHRLLEAPAMDSARFSLMDSRLHESWFKAMHKEHIWQVVQDGQNNYSRFRMLDLLGSTDYPDIVREHDALLDALARRDTAALTALIRHHLDGGVSRLQQDISTRFADYFTPPGRGLARRPGCRYYNKEATYG